MGIVGWATGGGHGWLTSEYGMGADNIFEVEMITPAGEIIVANECQNSDIFWATRGGGGGTFGVITSITMKAYPMPQKTQWLWTVSAKNGTDMTDWWKLVAQLHTQMPTLNEQGLQGYYTIAGAADGPLTMGGYFLAYGKSNATVMQTINPFITEANAAKDFVSVTSNVTRYDTWIDAYNDLPKQLRDSSDGPGGVISTMRLLTRKGLTEDVKASTKMFEAIGPHAEEYKVSITLTPLFKAELIEAPPQNGISSHILAGSLIASSKSVEML